MKRCRIYLATVLAAAAAAGCGDDPVSYQVPPGSLFASYSGDIDGSIRAEGAYQSRAGSSYAAAFDLPDTPNGVLNIGGLEYGEIGEARSLVMTLNRVATGAFSFAADCDFDEANCAYGRFEFDDNFRDPEPAQPYEIIGGTLTITEAGPARMRGTFVLEARRYDPETGAPKPNDVISLEGGTFDVPVVPVRD